MTSFVSSARDRTDPALPRESTFEDICLKYSIAVLLPCFNEERAIGLTVKAFREALPTADIYVYDNNSTDYTVATAEATGAIVRRESLQGKGYVVRRMFADVDADILVLADGDATYDAFAAPSLIVKLVSEQLDMVVGSRRTESQTAYRRGHRLGNWVLTTLLAMIFGKRFSDILSGYRVFSRRFVRSFPLNSQGFEIETEISVHALELDLPIAEVETRYASRPSGSTSKLSTYRDGIRILSTIVRLLRIEKPLLFFGSIALFFLVIAVVLIVPIVKEFILTGFVPRLPTAILSMGLTIMASLSFVCGLILSTVVHGRQEVRRLAYLALGGVR